MFEEFDENDKSEEFLADFRNKINQEQQESFAEKKEEINRSKNILVGAVAGIVLAGIVGFVAFSPNFSDVEVKKLPIVKRPQAAVKVQPMDPGGMEIANQDKSVYDIIEKKTDDVNESVESILPEPETIVAPIVKETVSVEEIIKEAEAKPVVVETVVAKVEPAKAVVVEVKKPEIKKPEAKPIVKVEPKAKPKSESNVVASGMWQVQIISSQNKKAVETSKADYLRKYAPLKTVPLEVEEATIAGKGTFYRLKAGAYKTKTEADKLCTELKKLGLSCFSKKK